jgi:4-amino-4-deoxy-L-arabinose transferase-like glycosyltransferase
MSFLTVLAFLFLNLAILLASLVLVHKMCPGSRLAEKILSLTILGAAQISLIVLGLGLAGRLSIGVIVATVLACSGSILMVYHREIRPAVRVLGCQLKTTTNWLLGSKAYGLYLMCLVAGVQIVLSLRKIYFLPPHVYDELTQHVLPVIVWFQEERIPLEIDASVGRVNLNPLGGKLLHFWFVRFFGDITWVELPQFLFALTIPLAAFQLMRFLHVGRKTSAVYALLIYSIPTILLESRTCQDHIMLAAVALTALVFSVRVIQGRSGYVWLLIICLGLLLGIHASGPLLVVSLGLALGLTNGPRLKAHFAHLVRRPALTALMVLLILALGGFWQAKNLVRHGSFTGYSDEYPVVSSEPHVSEALHSNRLLRYFVLFAKNWSELGLRLSDVSQDYSADLKKMSGFGIQFFAFGIPGYLLAFVLFLSAPRKRRIQAFILLSAVFVQLGFFSLYYSDYNYRLFVLTPVVGIVLFAGVFSLLRPNPTQTRLLQTFAFLMLVFDCLTTYYNERTTPERWVREFSLLSKDERTTASYSELSTEEWELLDQYIPRDVPVAYIGEEDSLTLPYYDNGMTRRVWHLKLPSGSGDGVRKGETAEALVHELARKGVRLLHIDTSHQIPNLGGLRRIKGKLYLIEQVGDQP